MARGKTLSSKKLTKDNSSLSGSASSHPSSSRKSDVSELEELAACGETIEYEFCLKTVYADDLIVRVGVFNRDADYRFWYRVNLFCLDNPEVCEFA